ncbi:DUF3035 domain-containing protein [Acidisphaera sp. L21]|uniref:DUF3035 domain-containing protein n=1 Tax=Acidisphaera sp. L21 TaxID=1641851 RepID=UPI00131AB50A|nr:DUF3035 domain-containing protein [Acidisphaera sp. L21]
MSNIYRLTRHAPALVVLASIGLSGCGGDDLSRTIGLTRDAPDEFTVTTRAPLSMPPDFSLRPPRPGASRPQELSERQQAEAALSPTTALSGAPAGTSPGQQALLSAAGPAAPRDIRNEVDSESQLDAPSQSFADRLMFWKPAPPPGTPVDPQAESQRLRQNAALGAAQSTGDTPIIQRRQQGILDSIF